jgi:RNase H-fold protein (predicted Holliday junction resolvase)
MKLKNLMDKESTTITRLIKSFCPKPKRVLFYTHIPRAFRSTLIGYLYEICQKFPTVLLSEKLDLQTEKILQDKALFPKLEKIISVNRGFSLREKPFTKNKELYALAKEIMQEYKPDVVVTGLHTIFELYLMCFAKAQKAATISLQTSLFNYKQETDLYIDLENATLRFPNWLPKNVRLFLARVRKYFKIFFFFYLLPLSVGQVPFFYSQSSFYRIIKKKERHYQTAWEPADYKIFASNGVPTNKLCIVPHPLAKENTKEFFNKVYFTKFKNQENKKNVAILVPYGLRFKKENLNIITQEKSWQDWFEIVSEVSSILKDWNIYIKPHPLVKNIDIIKKELESIASNVKVTDLTEPIEKYIEMSDIIIGLPMSCSTALYTASLQDKKKLIISMDNHHDLVGDFFKNRQGIIYIDDLEKLKDLLKNTLIGKNYMNQTTYKFKRNIVWLSANMFGTV